MKKNIIRIATGVALVLTATSCYNTRMYHGNVNENTQLVEVDKKWNTHLLGGLVSLKSAKLTEQEYNPGTENYMIKTNRNVWNSLISGITFGIYTPTQTKVYIPASEQRSAIAQDAVKMFHEVQAGETLASIAEAYKVTIGDLIRWNSLTSNVVSAGMKLSVYVK